MNNNNNIFSQNNFIYVIPHSSGVPLQSEAEIPIPNSNVLLQNNIYGVPVPNYIGAPVQNNASVPLQYVSALQTPLPVQNFIPPMQQCLSLPTQNRFILPKQNTIFINAQNLYQESIPSFEEVSKTSLNLNGEELPTNTLSSETTCKVEVKSECSSTDDSDITLHAHKECSQLKTFPHSPIKVKEEIKVEESFGIDDTNMKTSEWKVQNQNLLFVKEEKAAAIDIKEENFEDFHTNEHMSLSDPLDCTGFKDKKVEDIEIEEENLEDAFQLDNLSSDFNTFESPLRTDLEKRVDENNSDKMTKNLQSSLSEEDRGNEEDRGKEEDRGNEEDRGMEEDRGNEEDRGKDEDGGKETIPESEEEKERKLNRKESNLVFRRKIVGLFEANIPKLQIARQLGTSVQTVRKWVKRHEEDGNLCDRPSPAAKPRKTTQQQDREIANSVQTNPFTNAKQIKRELQLQVTTTTIRRRLREAGYHHRKPALKEQLREQYRTARLSFANEHIEKDITYWSRVIFTDEKTFCSTNHGGLHCYRLNDTRYEPSNVTCNVWGWINYFTLGELTPITGKFNSDSYLEILEEVFLPSVRTYLFPYQMKILYVQNNSPVHTDKRVKQWFSEHEQIIELLKWPSKSCDLNPIENVWAAIVRDWIPEEERTREALNNHARRSWEMLRRKHIIIENCISSMPSRLQSVIDSQGGWTKY